MILEKRKRTNTTSTTTRCSKSSQMSLGDVTKHNTTMIMNKYYQKQKPRLMTNSRRNCMSYVNMAINPDAMYIAAKSFAPTKRECYIRFLSTSIASDTSPFHADELFVVAMDLSDMLNSRRSSLAKRMSSYNSRQRCRARINCIDGNKSQMVSVFTVEGAIDFIRRTYNKVDKQPNETALIWFNNIILLLTTLPMSSMPSSMILHKQLLVASETYTSKDEEYEDENEEYIECENINTLSRAAFLYDNLFETCSTILIDNNNTIPYPCSIYEVRSRCQTPLILYNNNKFCTSLR